MSVHACRPRSASLGALCRVTRHSSSQRPILVHLVHPQFVCTLRCATHPGPDHGLEAPKYQHCTHNTTNISAKTETISMWRLTCAGAATAVVNYYRAMLRCLSYAPIPRVWAALRARLRMPVLAVMADRDGALEPGLMRDLEQASFRNRRMAAGCSSGLGCVRVCFALCIAASAIGSACGPAC